MLDSRLRGNDGMCVVNYVKINSLKGASKNSEFAQMQGVEKISPRRICVICKQEIFPATQQLG